MINIFDHTNHPLWNPLYNRKHASLHKTNGGFTYSEDIIKFHIPEIVKVIGKSKYKDSNILITTVGMLEKNIVPKNTDLIIYYLHEFIERELPRIEKINTWWDKNKIIYITSRKNIYEKLRRSKFKVILLPMSIDIANIKKYDAGYKFDDKRVIYFGNKYLGKGNSFEKVKNCFIDEGWKFDEICFNKYNGIPITREKMFSVLSNYKYGIGEGRCVLEMNALGIKTLICASACQGIMIRDFDFELQKQHNFSDGKIYTFSDDILTCVRNFENAIIKTIDVNEILPILKEKLKELL